MSKERVTVKVAGDLVYDEVQPEGCGVEVKKTPIPEEWESSELEEAARRLPAYTVFERVCGTPPRALLLSVLGRHPLTRVLLYVGGGSPLQEFRSDSWPGSKWRVADKAKASALVRALGRATEVAQSR